MGLKLKPPIKSLDILNILYENDSDDDHHHQKALPPLLGELADVEEDYDSDIDSFDGSHINSEIHHQEDDSVEDADDFGNLDDIIKSLENPTEFQMKATYNLKEEN